MNANHKRRVFLKGSVAAGTIGVAASAGLLTPAMVMAEWPADAFSARKVPDALDKLMGSNVTEASDKIKIKAPEIAENGAVVPITIESSIDGTESIALLAAANGTPLVATFNMGEGAKAYAATRIKLGKTGDVIAVCKSGGKMYSARAGVKVTIGGCGG